jgi:hypothetical protein
MKHIIITCLLVVLTAGQHTVAQTAETQDVTVIKSVSEGEPMVMQRGIAVQPFNVPVGAFTAHHPNMLFAAPGVMLGKLFPPDLIMRNQDKLGLTPKQAETIKSEMRSFQSGVVDIQWSLNESQSQLEKELANDKIDVNRALSLMDSVMKAENDLKKSHMALLIKIRNVLDAGQISLLEKIMPFSFGGFGMAVPAPFAPHATMEWRQAP